MSAAADGTLNTPPPAPEAGPGARSGGAAAASYALVTRVFVGFLGLIYLIAFVSLGVQILGLAGSGGIYPLAETLEQARASHGTWAPLRLPTLFWLWSGDAALLAAAWGGAALSLLLLAGRWQRPVLVALFLLYLSLFHAADVFTNFQWDYLLLETGFLALFLREDSRLGVWLMRWLLFRVRLLSGLSKLISQDPTWAGLTALDYYFETQPLPHAGAWYAHQFPDWLLRVGSAGTLFVEIVVPFFFLLPRPWRLAAAGLTVLWQVLIVLTSNHNFFNLLTIALCLFLLDDRALRRLLPAWLRGRLPGGAGEVPAARRRVRPVAALAAAVLVALSVVPAARMVRGGGPPWLDRVGAAIGPYHLVHAYHVFPVIKTRRLELEIEGSADGEIWRPYRLRYKPGDPARVPAWVVPHQPRLDWMLWFVPDSPVFMDWFERFLRRLLEGAPAVTGLLAEDPFVGAPPQALRVSLYRYRFTDPDTRRRTGLWWQRDYLGPFPPLPYLAAERAAGPRP